MNRRYTCCKQCGIIIDLMVDSYVTGTVSGEPIVVHLAICRKRYQPSIDDEVVATAQD